MPKSGSLPAGLLADFLNCKASLSRLVARIVKPHDIDDILQETFIRACAASGKTEIRNPRAFMLRTAHNLALNHISCAYNKRTQVEDFSSADVCPLTPTLESELETEERFLGFCRAVRDLPPQCRRVFVLRKVYGLSQREIAIYLDISESTVEKHVAKGLLLCRESMLEMGHIENRRAKDGTAQKRKRTEYG
jgi:RNA polymerase sigma factor (sigma-70 family)